MPKLIAAINMTIDGFCDHTAGIPDSAIHQHYADLLRDADTVLYGRITYQLMEYWRTVVKNPTGNKATDDFAMVMDKVPKLIFSHTMKQTDWDSARLATRTIEEEVAALRQHAVKDMYVGSPGLIVSLTKLNLIDEYQLCVHPVIAGSGLPLFKNIQEKMLLKLVKTKTFACGAIILYYEPIKQ
ncbi:MAG: dihydrofolate reductase family protein [Chitinophagaceae bacterium]